MVRRFKPTWTQADYQKVRKDYHRHKMMTKVVDSVLASGLSYTDIAKRAGVAQATITRWVAGYTKNGKIDTIMSVLEALNMEMVLVTRKEAHDNASKGKVTHVRIKSVTAS
jgi:DNA-binding phage protein